MNVRTGYGRTVHTLSKKHFLGWMAPKWLFPPLIFVQALYFLYTLVNVKNYSKAKQRTFPIKWSSQETKEKLLSKLNVWSGWSPVLSVGGSVEGMLLKGWAHFTHWTRFDRWGTSFHKIKPTSGASFVAGYCSQDFFHGFPLRLNILSYDLD